MPGVTGLEFLESLKESGHLENTPVVILTGAGSEQTAVEALKLGATDYLVKGDVSVDILNRTIKSVLAQTQLAKKLKATEVLRSMAEEKLRKAEIEKAELEGIHKVTATLAHEINNPLTGIVGMVQLLKEEAPAGSDTREMLQETLVAAKRIKDVILKMEALNRPKFKDYIGKTKIIDLDKSS